MMGWSPKCYIPSLVEIGPPVLEKKIFEGFLTIYGRLGHVTHMRRTKFREAPHKIGFDQPSGF